MGSYNLVNPSGVPRPGSRLSVKELAVKLAARQNMCKHRTANEKHLVMLVSQPQALASSPRDGRSSPGVRANHERCAGPHFHLNRDSASRTRFNPWPARATESQPAASRVTEHSLGA